MAAGQANRSYLPDLSLFRYFNPAGVITAGVESYGLAYADYTQGTDWESAVNSERDSIVNGLLEGGATAVE
jgi:hypothetical protein